MKTPCLALNLVAVTLMGATGPVHADAFHSSPGLAGSMVGYVKPLSSNLTLRADLVSFPGIARESIEQGASHTGHIKSDRGALFMDWAVVGSLRLTGGMTFNRTRVDLRAGATGATPMLGDVPYSTTNNDRFDAALRSPHALPYLGVGYGHHNANGSSFAFDVGATYGRASPSDTSRDLSLASVPQTALDQERMQLRDGIGRVRFMPQVSLGMSLRF
jgi:hypothetical protein